MSDYDELDESSREVVDEMKERERRKNNFRLTLIGILLLLTTLAGVVATFAVDNRRENDRREFEEYVACKAKYDDSLNERLQVLTTAAEQERLAERTADDAERILFTSPLVDIPPDQRTPAQRQELLDLLHDYQEALRVLDQKRREADEAREKHPPPPAPTDVCGPPPKNTAESGTN